MSPSCEEACRLAQAGIPVLATWWINDDTSCGCGATPCPEKPGKHPIGRFFPHAVRSATTDLKTLEQAWATYPKSNLAATVPEAIWLDFDFGMARGYGDRTFEVLRSLGGPSPETIKQVTGHGDGSFQLCFRRPEWLERSSQLATLSGLDYCFGGSQYVLVPPSKTLDSYRYEGPRLGDQHVAENEGWFSLLRKENQEKLAFCLREFSRCLDSWGAKGRNRAVFDFLCQIRDGVKTRDRRVLVVEKQEAARFGPSLVRLWKGTKPGEPPYSIEEFVASLDQVYDKAGARREPQELSDGKPSLEAAPSSKGRPMTAISGIELAKRTPAEPEWIVKPFIAKGAATELDGKLKLSGKSTLVAWMARSICTGQPFLNEPVKQGSVLWITEETEAVFRLTVGPAGLLELPNFYSVTLEEWHGRSWAEIVSEAGRLARDYGAETVIFDTISRVAGIKGDDEQSAGKMLEVADGIDDLKVQHLAVLFLRHERKSGGEVGQSGRGSSALSGDADQVLLLKRVKGRRTTSREVEFAGRFGVGSIDIDYETGSGYRRLGLVATSAPSRIECARHILEVIPLDGTSIRFNEIVASVGQRFGSTYSDATYHRSLGDLRGENKVSADGKGSNRGYRRIVIRADGKLACGEMDSGDNPIRLPPRIEAS